MSSPINTCPCPQGYIRDQSGNNCVKTTTVAATNNGTIYNVGVGANSPAYGQTGVNFYQDISSSAYPIGYTGNNTSSSQLVDANGHVLTISNSIVNSLWGDGNTSNGRLNNAGVWTIPPYSYYLQLQYNSGDYPPLGEYVGFAVCIDVPTTGTYCVGMAADNACRFYINGVLIVELFNFGGGTGTGITDAFNKWHVFPITLQAGQNIITVEGLNMASIGAFAAEIYNATPAQLAALTTTSALSNVTVFTTQNKVGQTFQTGVTSGYSCPTGYNLNSCAGAITCSITQSIPYNCCYLLTNCVTGATIITSTDVSAYIPVNGVITIAEQSGCWTVSTATNCTSTIIVTVTGNFPDCQTCAPCFRLTNCVTGDVIITNTNLSSSVGQVVNLSGAYAGCWTVTSSPTCSGSIAVVLVSTSATCFSCLPCFLLTNCADNTQKVTTNMDLSAYVGQTVQIEGYSNVCWSVTTTSGCTQSTDVNITKVFSDCTSCAEVCYILIDCEGLETPIITNSNLASYIGEIVQLKDCKNRCWMVNTSDTCVGAISVSVVSSFRDCNTCNPPLVCPAPELLHQRKVYPGYNTPGCSSEYTEKVNCEFAEQIYTQVKQRRYGISPCCEEDFQKWMIKKQLLDLRAIWDPDLCVNCPPISCCTPCPAPVIPIPPIPISCPAPGLVTAVITIINPCPEEEGEATATITFNNKSTIGFHPIRN